MVAVHVCARTGRRSNVTIVNIDEFFPHGESGTTLSITFDGRIQPTDRCCSRHDRGRSFGICFSSMVASPSRAALVRSGGRNASRSPCRTTFGWRSAAAARSSMDAWRPLDRSSSQAWARIIDFTSFWSILASGGATTCAVPFGFGVHGISIEPRFPFGLL